MLRELASIPLLGDFATDSLAVGFDPTSEIITIAWLEWRDPANVLRIAVFQNLNYPKLSVFQCPNMGPISSISVTAISSETIAIAWVKRPVAYVSFMDRLGNMSSPLRVGIVSNSIGGLKLLALNDEQLFISWNDAAVIYSYKSQRTYLVTAASDIWQSGVGRLPDGNVLRVTVGQHDPYLNVPRYRMKGTSFLDGCGPSNSLSFLLPTQIVGDYNAYPGELVIVPLDVSGFLVGWTLAPHHLGSKMQFQRFDPTGAPNGPIVDLSESNLASSVRGLSILRHGPDEITSAWTRVDDPMSRDIVMRYSLAEDRVTAKQEMPPQPPLCGPALVGSLGGRTYAVRAETGRLAIAQVN